MRVVASAREHAHVRTHELLADQLTAGRIEALDALLVASGQPRRTPLVWLRSRPTVVSAAALRRELDKFAYLREQVCAHELDLAALPPNRRAWLAQLGRRSTAHALARLEPVRRHPILAAFAVEVLAQRTRRSRRQTSDSFGSTGPPTPSCQFTCATLLLDLCFGRRACAGAAASRSALDGVFVCRSRRRRRGAIGRRRRDTRGKGSSPGYDQLA